MSNDKLSAYKIELTADEVQAITVLFGNCSRAKFKDLLSEHQGYVTSMTNCSYICESSVKALTEYNNADGVYKTYQKFLAKSKEVSDSRKPKTKDLWIVVMKDSAGYYSLVLNSEQGVKGYLEAAKISGDIDQHVSTTKQTVLVGD